MNFEHLLNQIVITVYQWQKFGGEVYEKQFEKLMKQLQKELQLDWEGTVEFLERVIAGRKAEIAKKHEDWAV